MAYFLARLFREAGIGDDALNALESIVRVRSYDAGAYLMRQGDAATDLFFITEGVAKMHYHTSEGREFVKSFVNEGDLVGSLMAHLDGGGSPFSVSCLERVEAECVPFKVVGELFESEPAAMAFGMRFFQSLALKKERREYSLLCLTPEERYRRFIAEQPKLARRVTQADIARYLGITPVALSRIRKRLKEEGAGGSGWIRNSDSDGWE